MCVLILSKRIHVAVCGPIGTELLLLHVNTIPVGLVPFTVLKLKIEDLQ